MNVADEADKANDTMDLERDDKINQIRKQAQLDPGQPGECWLCGEEFIRLINGACGRCRDKHGLP